MNQNTRTMIFVGIAVLAVIGAWATAPSAARVVPGDVVNTPLAADFTDPLAARSMEIVEFDESTGDPKAFKVAEVNGIWSLPSKYGYPADAERQLGESAANLMNLTKLGLASNSAADHALYGVVDPQTAKVGATGVGKRITLEGEGGKPLLDMIVGKEVKDQPDQRYVRIPNGDAVFPVKIDISKLSTKFEDWIEKDLLKVSGFDIVEVIENNYSVDRVQGSVKQGEVVDLKYDDTQSKWSMEGLQPGEELDTAKLNELKNALDDLKIVDVQRKPAGLSSELRQAEGIELDQQAVISLANKGFYLADGSLLSNEGEVIVHTKDGVEYVLRFGDIATDTEGGDPAKPADAKAEGEKPADGEPADKEAPKTGANRYIFVTARFDESLIPEPDAAKPAETQPTDSAPAAEPAADGAETPAAEPSQPESKVEGTKVPAEPAATPSTPQGEGGDNGGQDAAQEPAAPAAAATAPADQPAAPATDPAAADAPVADPAADAKAGPAAPADDPQQKALEAERLRKQSEYEDKIKKGQERVKELNARFADWYYVISDDVYKKIHLTRADVLKKPEPAKTEVPKSPAEQLQELEGGLKSTSAAPTP